MSEPTKRELIAAVVRLQRTAQEMFGAYANDVAMGRAERMEALRMGANRIAQPLIDRLPLEKIEQALAEKEG